MRTTRLWRCSLAAVLTPSAAQRVRSLIGQALANGQLSGPDGEATWQLRSATPGNVRPEEVDHAANFIAHGPDPT
jgi:hypothetical protein